MRYIIAALLACAPLTAHAQDWGLSFQSQTLATRTDGKVRTTDEQYVEGFTSLTERTGMWVFAARSTRYLSTVFGAYVTLTGNEGYLPGIEFAPGLGWEGYSEEPGDQTETHFRFAGNLRLDGPQKLGLGRLSAEGYYENGYDAGELRDVWYQARVSLQASEHISLGTYGQTGAGIGPRLDLTVPVKNASLNVWAMRSLFGKEEERKQLLVGVQLDFGSK